MTDIYDIEPAEVACPKCGAGVPNAEERIDELEAEVASLRKRDSELWKEAQGKLDARKEQAREMRRVIAALRDVAEVAIAISEADLSVYDDVPEAHELMNKLDVVVGKLQAVSSEQDA